MGIVVTSVITKAHIDKVFETARNIDKYTKKLPNLRSVRIIERSEVGDKAKVEWTAEASLLGLKKTIKWVQEDVWDYNEKICCFSCIEGDFKKLKGEWCFIPLPHGTKMVFKVDFKVSNPIVTPVLHKILDKIMERNNLQMLQSLKKVVEEEM